MLMEPRSTWWLFLSVVILLSPDAALCDGPKAIPIKAGEAICTLSKTLKDVTPWATQQVEEGDAKITHLEMKLLEWQSKFIQSKSKGIGSEACKITGLLFRQVRKEIDKTRKEVEILEREASKAAAFSANSAGRLDEFITVFANAKGESNHYCVGSDGAAKPEELKDCFGGNDFSEQSLVDIGEKASVKEPDLDSKIEGIKHQSLSSHFSRVSSATAGCNLIKGKTGGILKSEGLEKSLWWGGGILTIGKDFAGDLASITAGEISDATNITNKDKAFWTADPAQQIVHLKNASDAFKAFKAVQETIQDKVKSIEQKIQSCMGGQEPGENNTEQNATEPTTTTEQTPTSTTCFDNVAKIAADLKEKRALLARYQKVKGWIPPSSASHPITQFLGLYLTLL
ncbi:Transferrin receptor-like, ESAG6-like [Trypanosoma congolense IL3000]|uniref:Transferrin receptor-like, ESAG6-like n=1 Tax=Trypanosoma congolense (strain IL3000) TaxID=1068625 RepID=F9W6U4_TRYCI|nr:Transferrin receptor-like, ESAG6-like [Trypanosoma congolense IL3000]